MDGFNVHIAGGLLRGVVAAAIFMALLLAHDRVKRREPGAPKLDSLFMVIYAILIWLGLYSLLTWGL